MPELLAARVWANVDHAHGYVAEEASGFRQAILMSAVLPSDTRDAIRKELDGTVHAARHITAAVNMAIFSIAVASCIVLLMINDRPFNNGGIVVQPTALHELGLE